MKIGVISDTHDNLMSMQQALDIFKQQAVDLIVHCGDWVAPFAVEYFSQNSGDIPVMGVIGNNIGDTRQVAKRNPLLAKPILFAERHVLEVDIENGRKIACCHGHDRPTLEALISCKKYQAIFTGHTHKVRNEVIDGVLVLNPGTTCHASEGKIIPEATIAIYDSLANTAEIISF